ncbi:MAG: sn-glycerol-3-phosphate ABC transporter ATP-binding protein UgpC [Firmicutes bacterium]|nr:sn-glycerol-3-phosphate ABC transporter ATP-binding protein UgpC [Bacillota bacterium]
MARVELRNVSKRFGAVEAVRGVDLRVADGEFMVLVGPSGCGKSTLLRMIAGLEEVSEGEIWIGERMVNELPPKDRDVAMVFQNYALYPHMNVYENMAFGLRMRRVPRAEIDRRVRQVAESLGLGELLQRRPRELSGGQRQRVALGRAIVREPQVFLMDEPLSNLDAQLRVQTRTELIRLHQRLGTTTIYVTHDQVEAMTMGNRIAVLHAGRVQQVATPVELYDHPANMFVAGFIGSPQMNFVRGRIERDDQGVRFRSAGLDVRLPARLAEVAAARAGGEAVLGVRPEHVLTEPERVAVLEETAFQALVEVVEPLGAESYLHLTAGEDRLTVRTAPDLSHRVGERLRVALDPERLHLFDPDSQEALLSPQLSAA